MSNSRPAGRMWPSSIFYVLFLCRQQRARIICHKLTRGSREPLRAPYSTPLDCCLWVVTPCKIVGGYLSDVVTTIYHCLSRTVFNSSGELFPDFTSPPPLSSSPNTLEAPNLGLRRRRFARGRRSMFWMPTFRAMLLSYFIASE
jgi:hypothetical protein